MKINISKCYATGEEWRPAPGYEGLYEVSDHGRVKSVDRVETVGKIARIRKGKILSPISKRGYLLVNLCKHGTRKATPIHRLVALAFIPNPNNYREVNHKDESRNNNAVYNLEWCDRSYNASYGTAPKRVAEKLSKAVISTDENGNETRYASLTEAARHFNGTPGNICNAISGYSHSAWGLKWRYAND